MAFDRSRLYGLLALLLAVLFCVGLPLLSAVRTGAVHISHNDDWAFFRIPSDHVDGGFEWVGFQYNGTAQRERPNFEPIDTVTYRTLLGTQAHKLWVFRFAPACAEVGA